MGTIKSQIVGMTILLSASLAETEQNTTANTENGRQRRRNTSQPDNTRKYYHVMFQYLPQNSHKKSRYTSILRKFNPTNHPLIHRIHISFIPVTSSLAGLGGRCELGSAMDSESLPPAVEVAFAPGDRRSAKSRQLTPKARATSRATSILAYLYSYLKPHCSAMVLSDRRGPNIVNQTNKPHILNICSNSEG